MTKFAKNCLDSRTFLVLAMQRKTPAYAKPTRPAPSPEDLTKMSDIRVDTRLDGWKVNELGIVELSR